MASQMIPFNQIKTQSENHKIIDYYVEARKIEANITKYTQLNIIKTLKYFSRHANKKFKTLRDRI